MGHFTSISVSFGAFSLVLLPVRHLLVPDVSSILPIFCKTTYGYTSKKYMLTMPSQRRNMVNQLYIDNPTGFSD